MAWSNNAYCTLSDVKTALDPFLGTTDDTFISSLIIQAQADIDREVGYPFQTDGTSGSQTVRLYDGVQSQRLKVDDLLSFSQVLEIQKNTVLTASNVWVVGSTTTMDITADCIAKPNNDTPKYWFERTSGLPFTEGLQNYQVTGIWGYPTLSGQIYPGIPSDITRVTIRLAIHYYKMRDTNYADYVQEQGGIRQKYLKAMPPDVVEVLERYRRRVFLDNWR